MKKGISLDHIYDLRKKFIILGLTGETGFGCSEVATCLINGFGDGKDFEDPKDIFKRFQRRSIHNAFRKHRIVYNYAKENFKPFTEIKYKHVVTLFLLEHNLKELVDFVKSKSMKDAFDLCSLEHQELVNQTKFNENISKEFKEHSLKFNSINIADIKKQGNWSELYNFFFDPNFQEFSNKFHMNLGKNSMDHDGKLTALNYHKLIQEICNNLRKTGAPFNSNPVTSFEKIFTVVERINKLIKSHRYKLEDADGETQIVINSLKNPLEIMFFKQRYSAFYAIAVNKDISISDYKAKFNSADEEIINNILNEEYKGGENNEFYKQKVSECLQLSDIHMSNLSVEDSFAKNSKFFNWEDEEEQKKTEESKSKQFIKNTSPYFSLKDQILKFVTLINHPGIVSPSPEERCMQFAYSAKHNSGCISRQVGAAITDEEFSIKAIGWNNTPAGQVPCSLRNVNDLVDPNPSRGDWDFDAFTTYEKGTDNNQSKEYQKFKEVLDENFDHKVKQNATLLNGRNICFCFKSLKNSISEGKNQVHTRSLHAEENAFLQLTKYGGTGIKNGILFSTASPCELCSKKAYQLGITIIYYIDPYPGISKSHILSSGDKPIEVRLFNGAIGSAYHQLYQPIMAYKDELGLLLNHDIKDRTSQLQDENARLEIRNAQLEAKIKKIGKKE